MPRYAARKLTNEEECLPVNAITPSALQTDTARESTTTVIRETAKQHTTYNNNSAHQTSISIKTTEQNTLGKRRGTTATTLTLSETASPTKALKETHAQTSACKVVKKGQHINNTLNESPATDSTNIAPISVDYSVYDYRPENEEVEILPTTRRSKSGCSPPKQTLTSSHGETLEKETDFAKATPTTPTSPTATSGLGLLPRISLANLNATTALVGGHGDSVALSAGPATQPKKSPATTQVKRRRQKRSGRSRNSAKDNRRLAALRARRAQEQAKKAEEADQTPQQQQPEQPSSTILKSAGRFDYFDEAFLNKIEVLEDEVKKPVGKRKRVASIPVTTTINTRKRTAQRNILGSGAEQREPVATVAPTSKPDLASNAPTKSQPSSGITRKRGRLAMSLSERRYQTDDSGGGGVPIVRGGTLNGYINSRGATGAGDNNGDIPETSVLNGNLANISHAPSMATLCNIGNTCYLNSVVYTLRFAPRFLHNLHHLIVDVQNVQQQVSAAKVRGKTASLGRGLTGLGAAQSGGGDGSAVAPARSWSNKDAPIAELQGSNGLDSNSGDANAGEGSSSSIKNKFQLVSERLHELYKHLHCNEMAESTESFHADTLLSAIQDVSSIFEGNQQQDAHEFLMCLLNSLRETSQILMQMLREFPELLQCRIRQPDDVMDFVGSSLEPDYGNASNAPSQNSSSLSLSSLSASNLSKPSLFLRKSKRKDEAKSSKNSRLQSPLKDSPTGGQPTSNSLFYLNPLDKPSPSTTHESAPPAHAMRGDTLALKGGDAMDTGAGSGQLSNDELVEGKIREMGLNFFHEDFEGITVSTTKCLSCETVTKQKETMIDIAVPVPIAGYDSSDYSDKSSSFIQNSCITREYFRGENKYRCEQCTGYTEAIRSISYEVLPRLLIIQLSRFSGGMEKINSYIPTTFTLQCFCSQCCDLDDAHKLHAYKLYSVITHVGATMSVGHYIAYTTALDWAQEYTNCPKDRRFGANAQQQHQPNHINQQPQQSQTASSANSSSSHSSAAASIMKRMKLVRSKASSSGDVAKNAKQLNGLTSKAITNGIGKLSINTTCQSLTCCATRLCNYAHQQQLYQQQQQQQHHSTSDLNDESQQNGSNSMYMSSSGSFPSGYGSTARAGSYQRIPTPIANGNSNEPIWYMCDDDKIKAMSQREFEDLLSPSRKITVTPYLLFYARTDLRPKQASSPASSQTGKHATAETAGI